MATSGFGSSDLPIVTLIRERCRELGLSRKDLVRRTPYRNLTKGLRRLDALCAGDVRQPRGLISWLPAALEVPASVVQEAVVATRRQLEAAEQAEWRATFRPHAIILTERTIPAQIFIEALCNHARLRRVELDPTADADTFIEQAIAGMRRRLLHDGNWQAIPNWGQPVGMVVNYTPDFAVRYDLDGRVLEVLSRSYRLGRFELRVGGRAIPPSLFGMVNSEP